LIERELREAVEAARKVIPDLDLQDDGRLADALEGLDALMTSPGDRDASDSTH
jgi:hypothetical protein